MRTLTAILTLYAAQASAAEAVIDLNDYLEADQANVQQLLGKPRQCEPSKYGLRCHYKPANADEIKVMFIKGRADWVTVYKDDIRQAAEEITRLGLPAQKPGFQNPHVIRWQGLIDSGRKRGDASLMIHVEEIAVFPGYIYAHIHTK